MEGSREPQKINLSVTRALRPYAECYRKDLVNSVIPFWLKHSLDKKHGGYFNCLDRDGSVYDTKKYMWLQGREVYMFARLYNEFEKKPEYLAAAKLGADFIRKYGKDSKGRVYFSLTREGKPFAFQRKPYAGLFYMMAMLEYSRATGDRSYLKEAIEMFWNVVKWMGNPSLLDRPRFSGRPSVSNLADVMTLSSMVIDLSRSHEDKRFPGIMQTAIANVVRHYDKKRRVLIENVPLDGKNFDNQPEGRFFIPGHSIEVAWFLLHLVQRLKEMTGTENHAARQLALNVLEGSLELGWDQEYGGLYYFMDLEGRPTLQLESSMKLWWPHTEAIYALVLAYTETGDPRWLRWLKKVHDYSYEHFVDPKHGEWFGYCDRQGNLTHSCKGGNYKCCFHVPRFLLMSLQEIEKAEKKSISKTL
jgi:N-acylglucosamine 2-epimerase